MLIFASDPFGWWLSTFLEAAEFCLQEVHLGKGQHALWIKNGALVAGKTETRAHPFPILSTLWVQTVTTEAPSGALRGSMNPLWKSLPGTLIHTQVKTNC